MRTLKVLATILLTAAVAISPVTLNVSIASAADDQGDPVRWDINDFYSANDINYYDENAGDCTTGDGGDVGDGEISNTDLMKFLTLSVGATWNLSDKVVEDWVLSTGTAVIGRYGLNASNIGQVTAAVKKHGVSPMLFYGYTVNEGGGAGGFINHFGDSTGNAVSDAERDAEYIKNTANSKNFPPANGGGINMPSDVISAVQGALDKLNEGSIGRVYIPATSAATAEIAAALGKGNYSGQFGKPISALMDFIRKLGGNPLEPGSSISDGGGGDVTCDDSAGDVQSKIVKIAEEMAQWGNTETCYYFAGGHTSQADTDNRIEHKFAGNAKEYGVDCSGFASAVIYKATGHWQAWDTQAMCSDTKNFKEVNDPKPGDFKVTCEGHVAVITKVNGDGTFVTAESKGTGGARGHASDGCGKGVGPSVGSYNKGKTLRYIGIGSTGN